MRQLDWRNPEDYSYTDNLTMDRWGWEFLRRNPEYISEYEAARVKYISASPGPPFNRKYQKDYRPFSIPYNGACQKWGFLSDDIYDPIRDIPNPLLPNEPIFDFYEGYRSIFTNADCDAIDFLTSLESHEVAIVFDLRLSLKNQIAHFRGMLDKAKRKYEKKTSTSNTPKKRRQLKYWPEYLRILDALKAGSNEIAKYIDTTNWHHDKYIKNAIKTAISLSNGGYKKYLGPS